MPAEIQDVVDTPRFGRDEIVRALELILRDTEHAYINEIEAAWAETCRNLPREGFAENQIRSLVYPLKAGQSIIKDIYGIIQIKNIKILLGTNDPTLNRNKGIWVFLERVEVNTTDIFTPNLTPQSVPAFYEYFAGILKIFPAAGYDTPLVITADYGSGVPLDPCTIYLDMRLFTFCRNYCLIILYQLFGLGDEGQIALAQAAVESERNKLEEVRRRQTATGSVSANW